MLHMNRYSSFHTTRLEVLYDIPNTIPFHTIHILLILFCKNPTSKETVHKNKSNGHWKQTKKSTYD